MSIDGYAKSIKVPILAQFCATEQVRRRWIFGTTCTAVIGMTVGLTYLATTVQPKFYVGNVLIISITVLSLVCWMIHGWLWTGYEPVPALSANHCPAVTIIIPVYNEGAGIFGTIASVMASDISPELMHVIVIDDGSTDDTCQWLLQAKDHWPNQITLIRQPYNCGKREALERGFATVMTEFVVTVDSDTLVGPATIRHLLVPLMTDERMAGVAARIDVRLDNGSRWSPMLSAAFAVSFSLARSAQSVLGAVLCLPGACSAYRMTAVRRVVARWRLRTFLGSPVRIGEDRTLTSLLLLEGWHTCYQDTAMAWTAVPHQFTGWLCILLRWWRGDWRETFLLTKDLCQIKAAGYQSHRLKLTLALSLSWSEMGLASLVGFIVPWAVMSSWTSTGYIFAGVLAGTAVTSIWAGRSKWWLFVYIALWLGFCSWVPLWALITSRDTRWITRGQ